MLTEVTARPWGNSQSGPSHKYLSLFQQFSVCFSDIYKAGKLICAIWIFYQFRKTSIWFLKNAFLAILYNMRADHSIRYFNLFIPSHQFCGLPPCLQCKLYMEEVRAKKFTRERVAFKSFDARRVYIIHTSAFMLKNKATR